MNKFVFHFCFDTCIYVSWHLILLRCWSWWIYVDESRNNPKFMKQWIRFNISHSLMKLYFLFDKRGDVLTPNLVKSPSREIECYNYGFVMLQRCMSNLSLTWDCLNPNIAAVKLHEILWYDVRPLSEWRLKLSSAPLYWRSLPEIY